MKAPVAALALAASLGVAMPTVAQGAAEISHARTVATMYATAACVVETHGQAIEAFLSAPVQRMPSYLERSVERCLGSHTYDLQFAGVAMPVAFWRGALAAAYVRRRQRALPPAISQRRASYTASWMSSQANDLVVEEMSACLAETQPSLVDDVLLTPPASLQEAGALKTISQFMGPCLRQGVTLKTNPDMLHASLGEALYHREFDPASTTSLASAAGGKN
jgi:hypothetical protein